MAIDESKLKKIYLTLEKAHNEINRQNPDLAISFLSEINKDILDFEKTAEWAKHSLLHAEALAASCNPLTDDLFRETFDRLESLQEPAAELEFRAREHYADFLVRCQRRLSLARPQLERAKRIAIEQHSLEDSARIDLRIIRIDLQTDDDPQWPNFQVFKKVAARKHCTSQHQLAAWHLHIGHAQESARGMKFARAKSSATEEYFETLLEEARPKER